MENKENSLAFSLSLPPRFRKTLQRIVFNRASRSIAKTGFFLVFFLCFFSVGFQRGLRDAFFVIFLVFGFPGEVNWGSLCEQFEIFSEKGYPSILLDPTVFWSYFRGPALSGREDILRKSG